MNTHELKTDFFAYAADRGDGQRSHLPDATPLVCRGSSSEGGGLTTEAQRAQRLTRSSEAIGPGKDGTE